MLFNSKKSPDEEESQSQYVPRSLGLSKDSTLQSVYEFLVVGTNKSESERPEKILQTLQAHKATLVSVNLFPGAEPSDFVLSCTIDASKLDCTPDSLLIQFRKMRFAKRVEKTKMNGRKFSSFLFPLFFSNNQKSVVLGAQNLLAIEASAMGINGANDKAVSSIFLEEGRNHGHRIFQECIQSKAVPTEKLNEYTLDAIKEYLLASGWGIFTADIQNTVYISEPPIFDDKGSLLVGGSFLRGLVSGLLESKAGNGQKMSVIRESYSKERPLLTLFLGSEGEARSYQEFETNREQHIGIEEAVRDQNQMEQELPMTREDPMPLLTTSGATASFSTSETYSSTKDLNPNLGDLDIVMKILKNCTSGTQKIKLMGSTKLNLSKANEYIERLMKAALLEARKSPGTDYITYYTTQKGQDFQLVQEKLEYMLKEE